MKNESVMPRECELEIALYKCLNKDYNDIVLRDRFPSRCNLKWFNTCEDVIMLASEVLDEGR